MIIKINPTGQHTVLDEVYPKSEIYIREAVFAEDEVAVEVSCVVPSTKCYTARPIPYVTAENYVRCLSQTSYLLAEWALREKRLAVTASLETFLTAAANYEIYYRNLAMTFHDRTNRNEEFVLRLSIKNAREIKRLSTDYVLFVFANERTVISGEMSFVYVKQGAGG